MEREWPAWQVWCVQRVQGGPVWCARRRSGEAPVLNASSPEELAEALLAAEEQR